MTVSPKRRLSNSKETQTTVRSEKRGQLKRSLIVESLERRELLAADVANFQNGLFSHDVDGDFVVSPLDALAVINNLNANGARSLAGVEFRQGIDAYVDVDGDNSVTPLDVLSLVNLLNSGEGEDLSPKFVEVKYEYYRVNADGSIGELIPDSDPSTPGPDAVIGQGEKIIVRTRMKDLRSPATTQSIPAGIYAAYHNMNIINVDGSSEELLELQWSDYYRFTVNPLLISGSVEFGYGDKTATFTPVMGDITVNAQQSYNAFKNAMNSLFGEENILVRGYEPTDPAGNVTSADFEVHFKDEFARKRIVPELRVISSSLTAAGSNPAYSFVRPAVLDPTNDYIAAAAINLDIDNNWAGGPGGPAGGSNVVKFNNGRSVSYQTPADDRRTVARLGGFANSISTQSVQVATSYLGVVDTLFEAGSNGTVRLEGSVSSSGTDAVEVPLGIALINISDATTVYLGSNQVIWPTGTIQIVSHLSAVTDVYTFNEDLNGITPAVVSLNVIANDISRNAAGEFVPAAEAGTVITSIAGLDPTFGTATIVASTNQIEFRPTANANGQEVFTYTIRNGLGDTATGTVTVNLTPVNDPPSPFETQFSTVENSATPLTIAANEIFVPGPADEQNAVPPQTVTITAARSIATTNGTVSVVDGQVRYTPAANFNGTAFFVVDAADNLGATVTNVTLTITVESTNDAPIVVRSNFETDEDTPVTITPTEIFAPGPPDESSQTVALTIITPPAVGTATATIDSQGRLVVSPATDYFGEVTLEVRGTDNGLSPANLTKDTVLTITVNPVNDAPIAANDTFVLPGIGGTTILPVLGNDRPGPANETESITVTSVTSPSIGSASVVGGQLQYTIPSGTEFFGQSTSFSYTIRDAGGLTSTATVSVSIAAPASPYAIDDSHQNNPALRVSESSNGTTSYTFDVIANDYSELPGPITLAGNPTLVSGEGTLGRDGNLVTYTPPAGYAGEVIFTYNIGQEGGEDEGRYTATATILVAAVNDPPVAVEVTRSTPEDTAITIDANTLGLSSGPGENDILRFTTATVVNSAHGTASITDGKLTFTPAANFFGQARIRYVVTDNGEPNLASNESVLIINVTPVNDAPVANNDNVGPVAEDTSLRIPVSSLLANDSAGPGETDQTLSVVTVTGSVPTANGSIRYATEGGIQYVIYTPNANYHGTDTFTYQITDGQSTNNTATGTVTVTISEVNDAPVASEISKTAFAGVPATFDLTAELAAMSRGAANEIGQTLQIVRVVAGAETQGTVVLNPNGTITYTAPLNATGEDTFTYVIRDNGTTNGQADPKEATGTFKISISSFQPSSISGLVYMDDNANGVHDGNELRIGGADVILTIAADPSVPNSVAQTIKAVTLADGTYSFDTLPPGSYSIEYIVPSLSVDAPGANSFTKVITAPGGANEQVNFAVSGVSPRYASIIENLASSYYLRNPALGTNGLYATIRADGTSDWTSARGDFTNDSFHEVVLSADGTQAILTAVRGANNEIYSAVLNRNQFVKTVDSTTGVTLLRVMATSSSLNWQRVSRDGLSTQINASGYLDAVDELFATQDWE